MIQAWLLKWKWALFAVAVTHFVLAHYFYLGFVSWDGLAHRVPPVVELVQTGAYNNEKFNNWALESFHPFIELTNAPFLYVFGLRGLVFACAVALFPFCVLSMYRFARDLTGDEGAGLYTAMTYVMLPVVNAQLFSGYVDWAIPAVVAYFLRTLLRLGQPEPKRSDWIRFALAVFFFSKARQQGPYLAIAYFVCVSAFLFLERRGRFRIALKEPKHVLRIAGVLALALVPALVVHVQTALKYGSPIYPYRFEAFGVKFGQGMPLRVLFEIGGLPEYSLRGFWTATKAAYFVPARWPFAFYDGRNFGDSVYVALAVLGLPFTIPKMNRQTRFVLGLIVLLSLAARDFWQVRYAFGIMLSATICNGIAMSALAKRPKLLPLYVAALALLAVHAFRPEYDAWRLEKGDEYERINASGSKVFLKAPWELPVFPDMHAHVLIIHKPGNDFTLPLYGRNLTNSITAALRGDVTCDEVRSYTDKDPAMIVVDDEDLTKNCPRQCLFSDWRCMAWKIPPQ